MRYLRPAGSALGIALLAILLSYPITWAQRSTLNYFEQCAGGASTCDNILNIGGTFQFEGSTVDAFETRLDAVDPTADRTHNLPDLASSTVSVIAGAQSFTDKTLGEGTIRVTYRQDFDGPCQKFEQADHTVELVTDAAVNGAYCDGGIKVFSYRLDGAQASPFIIAGGALDIDNDGADNEGVEIVLADIAASTSGWVLTGTSVAKYFKANITITSVSGTDNLAMGWRLAAAHVDDYVLETYDTYGAFHINDNAGNIEIQTGDDTVDADDEADANAVWADAETMTLEVRVSTAGVFTFYQDDVAVTITTATGAAAAGDVLIPFIFQLNDSDADTETKVNWIEIGEVV